MKKIISILWLIFIIGIGTTFAKSCTSDYDCTLWTETCQLPPPPLMGGAWTCVSNIVQDTWCQWCTELNIPMVCSTGTTQKTCNNKTYCCSTPGTEGWSSTSVMGITCGTKELTNGQCKLNIYDTLGIRKSVRNTWDPTSVGLFVQDIVLSATFFIGTLVTVALVVSGLMFIFAASSGKDPANAKKGIIGSLVGLLIVVSSYVIIRLVQYIAKGF